MWGCGMRDAGCGRSNSPTHQLTNSPTHCGPGEKLPPRCGLSIARVVASPLHALYCGMKSSVDEIRRRFDDDVERFSNLETGQSSTIDAPLALELIVRAAAATTPAATHLLDVGVEAPADLVDGGFHAAIKRVRAQRDNPRD